VGGWGDWGGGCWFWGRAGYGFLGRRRADVAGGGWVGWAEWRGRGFPGFECHFVGCLRVVSSSGDAEFLLRGQRKSQREQTS